MSNAYQQMASALRAQTIKDRCIALGIRCKDIEAGKLEITSALPPKAVENQLLTVDPSLRIELQEDGDGCKGTITFADIIPLNE